MKAKSLVVLSPVYKQGYFLVRGGRLQAAKDHFARRLRVAAFGTEPGDPPEPLANFIEAFERPNDCLLWFAAGPRNYAGAAAVAHECVHASLWAMRGVGVWPVCEANEEALTYHVEWLFGQCARLWPGGLIK